jgi:hypothetical protein
MTEKELAKKAFEYRKELVPYTELGYPDVAIPVYEALDIDRAYVAGAKAMQKENEQLKNAIMQLRKQIDKMKDCDNCKYIHIADCDVCGECDYGYTNWELDE